MVGVDLSEEMLELLRIDLEAEPSEIRERVQLVHGDARELDLGERFEAVTCPFNGISHHHGHEELGAFLARVHQHLEVGGVFVFDVAVPQPSLLAGTCSEIPWFRDPVDGTVCRATERIEYDELAQILTITMTTRAMEEEEEREPIEMVLRLRQIFPAETLLLLRHHGFRIEHRETGLGDVLGYICRRARDAT